jgi:hypothetical protein
MIPGYNHNVKYKERIFHVQTEDSGVKNPHIITLLYYGGNILRSVKSSYAEKVGTSELNHLLPTLMQKQHKDVLRGLITGRYDGEIQTRAQGAAFLNGPAPLNVAAGSQHQASFGAAGAAEKPKTSVPTPVSLPKLSLPAFSAPGRATPPAPPPSPAADGSFSTEGSLIDAMAKAVPLLDADTLKKALDSNDDSYMFGDTKKGLTDMMADFFKGF